MILYKWFLNNINEYKIHKSEIFKKIKIIKMSKVKLNNVVVNLTTRMPVIILLTIFN